MDQSNNKHLVAIIGLIVIVMVIAVGAVATKTNNKSATDNTARTTSQSTAATSNNTSSNSTYKDGVYEATGSYDNPAGVSDLGVKLTIKDGVVTDSSLSLEATNQVSHEYQQRFDSGYKSQVVGKKISSISLSRVSGSSLTSQGFNEALEQIKSQAQS